MKTKLFQTSPCCVVVGQSLSVPEQKHFWTMPFPRCVPAVSRSVLETHFCVHKHHQVREYCMGIWQYVYRWFRGGPRRDIGLVCREFIFVMIRHMRIREYISCKPTSRTCSILSLVHIPQYQVGIHHFQFDLNYTTTNFFILLCLRHWYTWPNHLECEERYFPLQQCKWQITLSVTLLENFSASLWVSLLKKV